MLRTSQPTRGFTLVEMLVVITIVAILAGMVLAALGGAAESAKVQRAQQQIAKIDQLIMEKWNSYRYRQVPVRIPGGTEPYIAAKARLNAIRELMRMELPDRLSDINDGPAPYHATYNPFPLTTTPSLLNSYRRKVPPVGSQNSAYEQAECLYLILSEMRDGDRSALNFFMSSEIGDLDGDKMNEILDPWGQPIAWLRWAPGFSKYATSDPELTGHNIPTIENAVATMQIPDGNVAPDPFDPLRVDSRWQSSNPSDLKPFLLRPLIFSGGPDKVYDIYMDFNTGAASYSKTTPPNDPYLALGGSVWIGTPIDYETNSQTSGLNHGDNITNHGLGLQGE